MDIFVHNVPYAVSPDRLSDFLSRYIHSHTMRLHERSGMPTNFHVTLFRNPHIPGAHKGIGTLTIANAAVATAFLQTYSNGLPFEGRLIGFSPGKRSPDAGLLHELRTTSFETATARKERLEKQERLAINVQFAQLNFGLLCREETFSPEYDCGSGEAQFQEEGGFVELILGQRSVRIRTKSIQYGVYDGLRLLIVLDQAPILEDAISTPGSESTSPSVDPFDLRELLAAMHSLRPPTLSVQQKAAKRVRVGGFDDQHKALSRFISKALLITFPTFAMLDRFTFGSEEVGARKIHKYSFRIAKTSNLCVAHFEEIACWLQKHRGSIKLTYSIEALLLSGRILVKELVDLLDLIDAHINTSDYDLVCKALRNLTEKLLPPSVGDRYASGKVHLKETFNLCIASEDRRKPLPRKQDNFTFLARHLIVTPCAQYLEGPFAEQSNLILRRYADYQDHFLRVSFLDEDRLNHRAPQDRNIDNTLFIKQCVGDRMKAGFQIGTFHFDFLGYTMSALHEHTCYFVSPFFDKRDGLVTAQRIRDESGDYETVLDCPARYGARLSQHFTTSISTQITLRDEEIVRLPDIESNGSCFTDGAGTMSPELFQRVGDVLATRQSSRSKRRLFRNVQTAQVRIGGAKGMLVLDSSLSGSVVCLRPSMEKFMANKMSLEIAGTFTRPLPFFFYRSIIGILSEGGVEDRVFLELQADAIRNANRSKHSIKQAVPFLESNGLGVSFRLPSLLLNLRRLLNLDIGDVDDAIEDEFLDRCLEFGITNVLRTLKHKARILVPGAYTLVGVPDPYNFIPVGYIYARVERQGETPVVLAGPIAISRSPSEHPGMLSLLYQAKGPDCSQAMCKCNRSLPSCLGGGDLDGDLYNLILDKRLHPIHIHPPASYPPAILKKVDHDCTASDLVDFFCDYLENDILGLISIRRLHVADQSDAGTWSEKCRGLARLASKAVDFQKSGTPVHLSELVGYEPPGRSKPDFLIGEIVSKRARYYESSKILGQLYRAITLPKIQKATKESAIKEADVDQIKRRLRSALSTSFATFDLPFSYSSISRLTAHLKAEDGDFEIAFDLFTRHCQEMRQICASNSIRTGLLSEEEAVMGVIMEQTSQPRKRQDAARRLREQTEHLVKATADELSPAQALLGWQISLVANVFGSRSFGFVALGSLLDSLRGDE